MKQPVFVPNFFIISGKLPFGNTLICSVSSNIHYIVDVLEYDDVNRSYVKIHRPNSPHYLCSMSVDGISLSPESLSIVVSHLIKKYDL